MPLRLNSFKTIITYQDAFEDLLVTKKLHGNVQSHQNFSSITKFTAELLELEQRVAQ